MVAVGEGTFYDFWCSKREASIIRHEKRFISFYHVKVVSGEYTKPSEEKTNTKFSHEVYETRIPA